MLGLLLSRQLDYARRFFKAACQPVSWSAKLGVARRWFVGEAVREEEKLRERSL